MEYLKINNAEISKTKIGDCPILVIEPREKTNKTIVFYHGWSSSKENQIFRANIFASYGYRVLLPDAEFHGERNSLNLDYEDKKVESEYILRVIMHNIEEAPAIFEYIKENYENSEIAVAGHSMGAITAGGLYGFKKDLKMAFIYNGINNWDALVEAVNEGRNLEKTPYEVFRVDEFFQDMNPMNAAYLFKDRPIVLYNGEDDNVIDPKGQESFVEEIEKVYENKKLLDFRTFEKTTHQITTDMLEESIKFAKDIANF